MYPLTLQTDLPKFRQQNIKFIKLYDYKASDINTYFNFAKHIFININEHALVF